MTLVLDANVLVSAFAFPGTCRMLFESCQAPHRMARSAELEAEVRRTLTHKLGLPGAVTEAAIARWREWSTVFVPSTVPPSACRDRHDLHVLGLAAAADAELIVTGDQDLLVLGTWAGIAIVRPAEANRRLRGPGGSGRTGLAAERGARYRIGSRGRRR